MNFVTLNRRGMRYHHQAGVIIPFAQKYYRQLILAVAAIFIASMAMMTLSAKAASTVLVRPTDLALPAGPTTISNTWYFYNDSTNVPSTAEVAGHHQFTTGPDTPPLGVGSASFTLAGAGERWNIATNQFAGQHLTDWDALSFDMLTPTTSAGGTSATLFLNFDVDFDTNQVGQYYKAGPPASTYQNRLVYVPQNNGSPALGAWETWNAGDDDAMWTWSGLGGNSNLWPDGNPNALRSWSEILAAFPNIAVWNEAAAGQLLIRAGHPGPSGLQGSVDNVVVDETAFNFEPVVAVADKNACKNGGWMTSNSPVFKNQGDCVSFFASNGKAKGNPTSF
jgi:hypothetical protein